MTSTNHENDFVPASRGDLVASPYRAPLADIKLALDVAGLDDLLTLEDYADVDRESVHAALDGFASLAEGVIAPTDRVGDVTGAQFNAASSTITTPPFFREAYAQYVDGGWGALPFPLPFGGGGMPGVVGLANQEMFASANMALSLNPVLTQSVIEGLLYWGSDEQRAVYLPKLLTGEWSGTMNLTEAEAGSDLGEIKSLATPDANGEWRLTGTKIFITWGQHDLTENIIHLVLARTPDAPTGTKGLSLFVVPTIEVQPDGSLGDANSVHCLRIETKMGIHGSPTCEMRFEEARCELVGPLHGGMRAMFTVMNAARLSIGAQGPAIAERAFQQARGYAEGRLQGRNATTRPPSRSPIIDHPDVRRMLLSVATSVQAARLLLYVARAHEDRARHASDFAIKERSEQFANLLTPVAKAWSTDIGFSASSLSLQVLGGTGYMEEIGMTQRLRDARIPPIYEGTNGIQAIDLVTRKIPRDAGLWVRELLAEMGAIVPALLEDTSLAPTFIAFASALSTLKDATEWMLRQVSESPANALAGATSYLELFGITTGGWLMAKRAQLARDTEHGDSERALFESNFFATEILGRATGLRGPITAGAERLNGPIGA